MNKIMAFGILFVLAALVIAPAGASLVGTAFGFPTIVQSGTTTAFNRDTAAATDTEAFALAFPTGDCLLDTFPGITPGVTAFNLGLPTIAQTVAQTQVLTHCDFATTSENAAFAYPFVGVGGACIPGFGFGF